MKNKMNTVYVYITHAHKFCKYTQSGVS